MSRWVSRAWTDSFGPYVRGKVIIVLIACSFVGQLASLAGLWHYSFITSVRSALSRRKRGYAPVRLYHRRTTFRNLRFFIYNWIVTGEETWFHHFETEQTWNGNTPSLQWKWKSTFCMKSDPHNSGMVNLKILEESVDSPWSTVW